MGWFNHQLATSRPWGACLLERDWKMLKNESKYPSPKMGILGKTSSSKVPLKELMLVPRKVLLFLLFGKIYPR